MSSTKHLTTITPTEWSTASQSKIVARGPLQQAIAGKHVMVCLDLTAMPPEERYSFARTVGRWCQRVEQQALADIELEAQAPLFDVP